MRQIEDFPTPDRRERKYRRFNIQFPVRVSFPSAGLRRSLIAVSKNVSIGGILVKAENQIPAHTAVSLTIDVRGLGSGRAVRLLGEGEVVRVESLGANAGFAIAIECSQPIREMQQYLPTAC
jgi:hypothetical protein